MIANLLATATPRQIIAALITGLLLATLSALLIREGLQRLAAERDARLLVILAGVATARPGCGCTFWDSRGDRFHWQPCDDHRDQLLKDVTAR